MKLPFNLGVRAAHFSLIAMLAGAAACNSSQLSAPSPDPRHPTPQNKRQIKLHALDAPAGLAICYGPYRQGQAPGGKQPTKDQLAQDLRIIARNFNTLRTYSTVGPAPDMLEVIREEKLPITVFLGVWIAPETDIHDAQREPETLEQNAARNRSEIDAAIRLANQFPDIVAAVIVGNETQIAWSGHRTDPNVLIAHIRRIRQGVRVPVTTADDFNFWNKPESNAVAREIDFIITHAYAMWNGTQLHEAIDFTDEKVRQIRQAHPNHTVILGETGWATQKHDQGEQATLIKEVAGEPQQAVFFDQIRRWAADTQTTVFLFEAFDEPWKGGAHPNEVEKHWGVYNVDRTPKLALQHAKLENAPTNTQPENSP